MIEWTEQAMQQLDNSDAVASRITMQIVTTVEQLKPFPMSGRAGRVPGTL